MPHPMSTSRARVPLGLPTVLGVGSLGTVVAVGGQGWQMLVSALLCLALVATDTVRLGRGGESERRSRRSSVRPRTRRHHA